jgi:hypothetical protein
MQSFSGCLTQVHGYIITIFIIIHYKKAMNENGDNIDQVDAVTTLLATHDPSKTLNCLVSKQLHTGLNLNFSIKYILLI